MNLHHMLNWFPSRTTRRTRRAQMARPRWRFVVPRLETLEDRIAPAAHIDGLGDFTIQQAVMLAPQGSIITVDPGMYTENVIINTPDITLLGAQANLPAPDPSAAQSVVDASTIPGGTPFIVRASGVTIKGFTIQGGNTQPGAVGFDGPGIYMAPGTSGTEVMNNIIQNNSVGIFLTNRDSATPTLIANNLIQTNNRQPGGASGDGIYADQFTAGNANGITVNAADILDNTFIGNRNNGVILASGGVTPVAPSDDINILDNTIMGSNAGVAGESLTNSLIAFNTIEGSSVAGIRFNFLSPSVLGIINNNDVIDNNIFNNSTGILVASDSQNIEIGLNTLNNNPFGVDVQNFAHDIAIIDNIVQNSSSRGIRAQNNTFAVDVSFNKITNNVFPVPNNAGVAVANLANQVLISENTITGYLMGVIIFDNTTQVGIFQNTIFGNGTGVNVRGNGQAVISENSIFDNEPMPFVNGGNTFLTPGLGIDLSNGPNNPGFNAPGGNPPVNALESGVTLNRLDSLPPPGTTTLPNKWLNFPVLEHATIVGPFLEIDGWARPGSLIELFIAAPDPTGFGEGKTFLTALQEGSDGSNGFLPDLDPEITSYGPGPINGVVQGEDTTNRFLFLIPLALLPAPVGAGTVLTSTATLPDPVTSEFSPNVMVTQSPLPPLPPLPPIADVSVTKQANQTTAVLGTPVTFTIIAHNNGPDTATDVAVNDIPLGGLSFVSAAPSQGSFDPASGHWTVGTLANGATATLQLTYIVSTTGPISNVAIETADQLDPDPSDDVSAVTIGLSKRSFLSSTDPPPNAAMAGLFNAVVSQWVNLWAARLSAAERLLAARNGPGNGGVPSI